MPCDFHGPLERQPRPGAIPGAPLRVAQAEHQVSAPFAPAAFRGGGNIQRTLEVDGSLLIGEHGGRAIARADEVLDGRARVAEGRRETEVMRDLGQVWIEVVAVHALEQATQSPVELEPPARREILVERLPHKVVGERVPLWRRAEFDDESHRGRPGEHGHDPGRAERAGPLEQIQVELAADDGRQPEGRNGLPRQRRNAVADHGSDLLRNAEEALVTRLIEALERSSAVRSRTTSSEKVRIASGDLVQLRDGPAAQVRLRWLSLT